jgi:hypothetical protein
MMTQTWTPTSDLDDDFMVAHAARRGLVKLANGCIRILVAWSTPQHRGAGHRSTGRSCLLATNAGTRHRCHQRQVVEVLASGEDADTARADQ